MQNYYRNKKVLITGGCGFIGSNLAVQLVNLGAEVTVADSMLAGFGGNLFNLEPVQDRLKINFSDMRDEHSLSYLIRDKDIIFNLAGQISHIDSMTAPMADLDINCRAQLSLLEACRHDNSDVVIVFASTRQIYGRPQYLPVDESHPISPVDVNGINKAAGEWYHTLYHNVYGLKTVSLRLTNTYGPRQAIGLNNQGFLGIFVRLAIQGEKIKIFGTGEQLRDFNYVDDVSDALLLAGRSPAAIGKIYNLGHSRHYSLKHVVEILNELTGVNYELVPFPPEKAKIDIGDYYTDISLIGRELDWKPRTELKKGFSKTLDYFRENLDHYVNSI